MPLNQKETTLMKDMKDGETLCIDKYTRASDAACDPQLKNLFSSLAENERRHLDTLTQIENGTVPAPGGASASLPTFSATYKQGDTSECAKTDAYLCKDALTGEKQVSSLYNTGIFEFTDEQTREVLAGIQKQEQTHGKMLYDYMKANGFYG